MKIEGVTYTDFASMVIEFSYLDDWYEALSSDQTTGSDVGTFRYFYKGKTYEELYIHDKSRLLYEYLETIIPRLKHLLLELINE